MARDIRVQATKQHSKHDLNRIFSVSMANLAAYSELLLISSNLRAESGDVTLDMLFPGIKKLSHHHIIIVFL
jgi:hypothetical protein